MVRPSDPPAPLVTMAADFDTLWDYDDAAGTERAFRALLPELAADPLRRAELLSQIARAEGLQRRFEDAYRTLDQADAVVRSVQGVMDSDQAGRARAEVRCLLERGRVLNSSGDHEGASGLFRVALERARAASEEHLAVDAAHMLGISEPPERRLKWNLEALAMAEVAREPRARAWSASLHNNIGWSYHDAGDFERALEMFERALTLREEQGKAREIRIAKWCVARALRSLGRIDQALGRQRALWDECKRLAEPDGFVCEEVAECLLALGRADEARPFFARAHALLSADPWLAEREAARLERLKALGLSS